ncbi:unnamed protein product [Phyllotreta striolata]|uniref:Uncharacterized protein n=1 Tax=Phyllotreta striolata TaxID=444603 RepID=A0A9N9TVK2_PHYSR|nr:unnamed protein product [Phyllotreta striolata]
MRITMKMLILFIINVISSSLTVEGDKNIVEGPSAMTKIVGSNGSVNESKVNGAKILLEKTSSLIAAPGASTVKVKEADAVTPATAADPHKGAKVLLHVPKSPDVLQNYPPLITTDDIPHTPKAENKAIPLMSNIVPHFPVLETKPVVRGYMERQQKFKAYPMTKACPMTPVVQKIAGGESTVADDTKIMSILAPIMAKEDRPVKKTKHTRPNPSAGHPEVQARAIETELTHVLTDEYLNHALLPIIAYHPVPCIETERYDAKNKQVIIHRGD